MSVGYSILGVFLTLWASSVLITVYNLTHFQTCPPEKASQCYHPFFRQEDDVFLSLHIQDSTGVHSNSIWNATKSFANLTIAETLITIPVPPEVRKRAYDESFNSFKILFRIAKIIDVISDDEDSKGGPALSPYYTYSISIPVTAYRRRRIMPTTKNLLSKNANSSSDKKSPNEQLHRHPHQQQTRFAHHWKFSYHPLVLRFTTSGGVLRSSHIHALQYDLSTRVVNSPSGRRLSYLPILWVSFTFFMYLLTCCIFLI